MLAHPTLDQLNALGLYGLAKGFKDLEHKPEARARAAKLRHGASVEDIDYQNPRGLDRALFLKLAACDWIAERRNLLITGAAGLGKSWLACALGHKACRENISVLYTRVPRLFADLAVVHGSPGYARLLRTFARVKLLILDDWGPEVLNADQARDLLEIVEDRYDKGSIVITSRFPWTAGTTLSAFPPWPTPSSIASFTMPTGSNSPARACANAARHHDHRADHRRKAWRHRRRDKAVDNGGLRYGAMESALKPAVAHRHPTRRSEPEPLPQEAGKSNRLDRSGPGQHHSLRSAEADVRWPTSNRNPGRLQIGIGGRLQIGMPGRLRRNPQTTLKPPSSRRSIAFQRTSASSSTTRIVGAEGSSVPAMSKNRSKIGRFQA